MADREKVIKGLECCSCKIDAECNECPYNANGNLDVCGTLLADDALELLKEQEPVPRHHKCIGECYSIINEEGTKFCPWCGRPVKWE